MNQQPFTILPRFLSIRFLFLLTFGCSLASADWPSDPTQNLGICTATGWQSCPGIVSDGAGGALVVWQDGRAGENKYNIYAQRVSSNGAVQWTPDGTAVCSTGGYRTMPSLVGDGSGGAIIAWQDKRSGNQDVYAQRVNSSGQVQWTPDGVAICSAAGDQQYPLLTSDGAGGAIVAWQDGRGADAKVYARRIDSSGQVQWTPDGVAVSSSTGKQETPVLVGDGSGGAVVAWQDYRSGTTDIYAQRVDADGTIKWGMGSVVCTANGAQYTPVMVGDGGGGGIVAWQDQRDAKSAIYTQRIGSNGTVQWTPEGVKVGGGDNYRYGPNLYNDGSSVWVAWTDSRAGNNDVYGNRLNLNGEPQWATGGKGLGTGDGEQTEPYLVGDGAGGVIVGWGRYLNEDENIYAQRFNPSGQPQWTGNPVAIGTGTGSQWNPWLVSDGSGGSIVIWEDYRAGEDGDIYGQRVYADGTLRAPAGFAVSPQSLTVPEGGNDTFTVALGRKPSTTIDVTVTNVAGDPDLQPSPPSLQYTPDDWSTPQTVTVSAAEDDDVGEGTATIRVTGKDMDPVNVTVKEKENDTQAPVVSTGSLTVPEGGSETFTVALKHKPSTTIDVTVTNVAGDPDLQPSPPSLQYTPTDWSTPQTVTVSAAEDDDAGDGTATIRVTGKDMDPVNVTVKEKDNETQAPVVSTKSLTVPEGGNDTFTVALKHKPLLDTNVTISNVGGDPDLQPSPPSLQYTPEDWSTPQTVTVSAAEDDGATHGNAQFKVDVAGGTSSSVNVYESDNDTRWPELGLGSGTAGGVSNDPSSSYSPSIAMDVDGNPLVAWHNHTSAGTDIYVRRWNGTSWEEVGNGSATGTGISNNSTGSTKPSIAVGNDSKPVVAWQDNDGQDDEIYVRRWNGSSWEEVGNGSASGGGISGNSTASTSPSVAIDSSNHPVVAWQDNDGADNEIYVRRWNGTSWEEVGSGSATGGGISNNTTGSTTPSVAVGSDEKPVVVWQDGDGTDAEIYVRRWDGTSWVEVGSGSATGGGVSSNTTSSTTPSVALGSDGNPVVVWQDNDGTDGEIYLRRWNGTSWEEVGRGSATGGGISNNTTGSTTPSVAVGSGGYPVVAWQDSDGADDQIFVRRWNGSFWGEVDPGSASGAGVSANGGKSSNPSVTIGSANIPIVAWQDDTGGDNAIYARRWMGNPRLKSPPWYPYLSGTGVSTNRTRVERDTYPFCNVQIWHGTPEQLNSELLFETNIAVDSNGLFEVKPSTYYEADFDGVSPGDHVWRYRGYDSGSQREATYSDWQANEDLHIDYGDPSVSAGSLIVEPDELGAKCRRNLGFLPLTAQGYTIKITGSDRAYEHESTHALSPYPDGWLTVDQPQLHSVSLPAGTYSWQVRAYNPRGTSAWAAGPQFALDYENVAPVLKAVSGLWLDSGGTSGKLSLDTTGNSVLQVTDSDDDVSSLVSLIIVTAPQKGVLRDKAGNVVDEGVALSVNQFPLTYDADSSASGIDRVVLRATDQCEASSDVDLAIYLGFVSAALALPAGWNLISIPMVPHPAKASELLAVSDGKGPCFTGSAWAWDAANQSYTEVEELAPKRGYWIYANGDCAELQFCGARADAPSAQLRTGWNLIGPVGYRDYCDLSADDSRGRFLPGFVWEWRDGKYARPDNHRLPRGKGIWLYTEQTRTVDLELKGVLSTRSAPASFRP